MSRCLFIAWDGPQVSYIEGLFLPIFKYLAKYGHQFYILQFTWADSGRIAATEARCLADGIPYRAVKISRRLGPLGPLMSAIRGASDIKKARRDWGIDTLMPRSIMPALAVLAMGSREKMRLVFDADGFAVDERVDFGGLSPRSITYLVLRAIEAKTTRDADVVLVRTPRAIDILVDRSGSDRAKFHIVGNGRDPEPFLTVLPRRIDDTFRLCYAGSIGAQYLPVQMIELAKCLRIHIPNLVFRVFTGDQDNLNIALDQTEVFDRSWIEVSRLTSEEMPLALMECDLALALRESAFSTQGVAPIKIGEYMLAGLPVIGTDGVGPVEPLIEAGVMFPLKGDVSQVWPWIRDNVVPHRTALRKRAQALGLAHFSLKASVDSYLSALDTDAGVTPRRTF